MVYVDSEIGRIKSSKHVLLCTCMRACSFLISFKIYLLVNFNKARFYKALLRVVFLGFTSFL